MTSWSPAVYHGVYSGTERHPILEVDVFVVAVMVQPVVGTQEAVVHLVVTPPPIGETVQDTTQPVTVVGVAHEEVVVGSSGDSSPGGGPSGGGRVLGQSMPEQLLSPPLHPRPRQIVQKGPIQPRQLSPKHVSQNGELQPEQSDPYNHFRQ